MFLGLRKHSTVYCFFSAHVLTGLHKALSVEVIKDYLEELRYPLFTSVYQCVWLWAMIYDETHPAVVVCAASLFSVSLWSKTCRGKMLCLLHFIFCFSSSPLNCSVEIPGETRGWTHFGQVFHELCPYALIIKLIYSVASTLACYYHTSLINSWPGVEWVPYRLLTRFNQRARTSALIVV